MGLIPGLGKSPGVENGNLLWYSYLENSNDRGAWQAIVHRAAKRRMWLSTHTHTHTHTHTQLYLYLCVCVSHSVMSICDLMDCSLPGSSVHGFSMQEYQSGSPFPSPEALPHPGIEPGSPALQIDSLLTEPLGKPQTSPIMGLEPTTLRLRASCFTEWAWWLSIPMVTFIEQTQWSQLRMNYVTQVIQ